MIFRLKPHLPQSRDLLLDFIRGLAMLLVLYQHAAAPLHNLILAFHMPLLFVLSGYTEFRYPKEYAFKDYLNRRFFRLLMPYFLFEFANLMLWQLVLISQRGWQDVSEAVKGILLMVNTDAYMGFFGRLWFLPCMFVADLLFFTIKSLCRGRKHLLWFCTGILLALSWFTSKQLPYRLPFTLDTGLMAAAFLILGYILGDKIHWLLTHFNKAIDIVLFLAAVGLLCASVYWGGAYCLMYDNNYGNYLFTILAAASGTVAFFIASKWIYRAFSHCIPFCTLILWYGVHSLAVFPVHLLIKMLPLQCFDFSWHWAVLFPVMLLGSIPMVNLITVYFPFMLGKIPTRKR